MRTWLRRHVAWRLQAQPPIASSRATESPRCPKCKRVVEDRRFKMCVACRASSTKAAKKRARKRKLNGLCPKCGKPTDGHTVVCPACLAQGRDRYHGRAETNQPKG